MKLNEILTLGLKLDFIVGMKFDYLIPNIGRIFKIKIFHHRLVANESYVNKNIAIRNEMLIFDNVNHILI